MVWKTWKAKQPRSLYLSVADFDRLLRRLHCTCLYCLRVNVTDLISILLRSDASKQCHSEKSLLLIGSYSNYERESRPTVGKTIDLHN